MIADNVAVFTNTTAFVFFCSVQKEIKKAVENQLLRWFSMARVPIAPEVGINGNQLIAAVVDISQ